MTVAELIRFLSALPPEMDVMIEKTRGTGHIISDVEVHFEVEGYGNSVHLKSRYPFDNPETKKAPKR